MDRTVADQKRIMEVSRKMEEKEKTLREWKRKAGE
jgi:hypothetical protein